MSVPTHGPFCQTWIYSTSCWDCQEDIWVLQCTCGSVVLLDERGAPWPKHACADGYRAGGIGGSGFSGWAAVSKLMEMGIPISPDVRRKIFPSRQNPTHIAERRTEIKRIATVDAMSGLGRQLLGLDPVMNYRQITLVVNVDRPNKSFTGLVPDHFMPIVKRGMMVMAKMFGSVRGDFSSWVITDIDPF